MSPTHTLLLYLCIIGLLLPCSQQQSSTTFQSGIRTLILQRNPSTSTPILDQESPFRILFSKSFQTSPLALVAPLTFSDQPVYHQISNHSLQRKVKIFTKQVRQSEVEIAIQSNLFVLYLRTSYLFVQKDVAKSIGIFILNQNEPQYNPQGFLNKQKNQMTKIKEIIYDESTKTQENGRQYNAVLPYGMQKYFFHIFLNELNMMQKGLNFYNISLNKKANEIQILLTYHSQPSIFLKPSFPAYTLLIKEDLHDRNQIVFQRMSVSIPKEPFSERINQMETIFIGLTGFYADSLDEIMGINFSKNDKFYLLSKDGSSKGTAVLDFCIITIQPIEQQFTAYTSRLLLVCTAPQYPTTYQNSWTNQTDPKNTTTLTCQACPTGCFNCAFCSGCYRFVNCTLCRAGFNHGTFSMKGYTSQKVCTCPSGSFPNSITNTCMACNQVVPNCVSCISMGSGHFSATCGTCSAGYFGIANTGTWKGSIVCYSCGGGCTACAGSITNCSSCATGFKKSGGVCVCSTAGTYFNSNTNTCTTCALVFTNCTTCVANGTITTCSACTTGYYVSNGTCVTCGSNCANCTSSNCTSCQSTFIPSGTSCVCDATAQMFLNATSNKCVACTSFVSSCSTCVQNGSVVTCSVCTAGKYLNGSSCVSCPSTCTNCTDILTCITCISNLIVINGSCTCDTNNGSYLDTVVNTCISCSQKLSQCTTCDYNSSTSSLLCIACTFGNFVSNDSCTPCPSTCLNCTALNVCGGCITGYQLNNVTNLCDCIDCVTCNSSGIANCVACNLTNATNSCTACLPGTYLDNGTCTTCPVGCATCSSSSACQTCNLPFIVSTPAGQCVCNGINLVYYDPSNQTCSSCASILINCTSCSSSNYTTTCLACTNGSYVLNGTCATCPYPCTTCSSGSVCSSCTTTFALINNTCTCNAGNQLFLNNSTNLCASCTSLTTSLCLSCSLNPNATSTSGVSCSSCQVGYFPDAFLCTQCPSTCTDCSNLTSCSTCQNTYQLINGTCICDTSSGIYLYGGQCLPCYAIFNYCQQCDNSTTVVLCLSCGTGTYLVAGNTSCKLCPVNCDSCDSTGCITCSAGFFLNGNGICDCLTTCIAYATADPSCVDCALSTNATTNLSTILCNACKQRTFIVGDQNCNACPPSCATCVDYISCLTCLPSFTLINGECVCNTNAYDVSYSSLCHNCAQLMPGCIKCTVSGAVTTCTECTQGWGLENGICYWCGIGCKQCTVAATIPTCINCDSTYLNGSACTLASPCDNSLYQGYYDVAVVAAPNCSPCMANCQLCYDANNCIKCVNSFKYINKKCVCNNGLSYYLDNSVGTGTCIPCQTALDPSLNLYLAHCLICQTGSANYPLNGIECLECADGYFLALGTCVDCMYGCQKCSTNATCCSCNSPSWIMVNGTCMCNNDLNYFYYNISSCLPCTLTNCSVCSSLTTCIACTIGSFINGTGQCQLSICGNGITQGIEQCDDNNTAIGDGCNAICELQLYYFCVNTPPPSACYYDNRFNLKVTEIVAGCNTITFKFQIYPWYSYYDQADYNIFLTAYTLNASSTFQGYTTSADTISYTFSFNQTIQGSNVDFIFDPGYLGLTQTASYPPNIISVQVLPTNNMLAIHYERSICKSKESFQKLTKTIQYASYGTLILSALPCKIVGLELIGVLQLSFFSLGSMDNVNVLMSPMMGMKGVNGFSMDMGKDPSKSRLLQTSSSLTPSRINSIGYNANFLRNCNVMLMLVIAIIFVSLVLFLLTYLLRKCAQTLHSISKRLIKQVLLTLILFNCLNFAYSAGIHFRYASRDDSLYLLGTLAAAATLIIPILMAIGLSMSEEDGFGEFKDKMKPGCVDKAYFVVTIIYRMCLGLYMSASNEDEMSTLIVLAVSILFLLYNLVNLPFTKAYHNYRANICHFCQFIVLFIAMYYRSMKSSSSSAEVSGIYSPVYLEYGCILASLIVSLAVLAYEICIWVKECCEGREKRNGKVGPDREGSDTSEAENKIVVNNTEPSIENQPKIDSHFYDEYDTYN